MRADGTGEREHPWGLAKVEQPVQMELLGVAVRERNLVWRHEEGVSAR